jgi:hypothetical protein
MKKVYLTIEMIEKMKGDYSKVKIECTKICDGRHSTFPSKDLQNLVIDERTSSRKTYWVVSWDDDCGSPKFELHSKKQEINRISDSRDSEYEHSLFLKVKK